MFGPAPFAPLANFFGHFLFFINSVLVPVIFAIAFVTFLWYAYVHFIQKAGDEKERSKSRMFLLYSLAGFVVMISLWGLVNLLVESLRLDNRVNRPTPIFAPK